MIYLGFDPGYGNTKLYGDDGGLVLPSHVAVKQNGRLTRMEGMVRRRPPLAVTLAEHSFYVGGGAHDWGAPVESMDYTRLTGSPEVRATLYAALTEYQKQYGAITAPITLMVGLPQGALGSGRQVGAVKQWLLGDHRWRAGGEEQAVTIAEVLVTAQATGALYDYVLDGDGRLHPERAGHMQQELGVVSLGFNTLELMVIRDRKPVERLTVGSKHGVRRLLQGMAHSASYSMGELDDRLRSGHVEEGARALWLTHVVGQLEQAWGGDWRRFAQVVVVGGGALLLRSELTAHFRGRCYLPDEPVLAVARGMWRMLRMRQLRMAQTGRAA